MENILVTIAVRGGSKGIKGKNVRPLLGKPLIAYSIQQALDWKKAKHVVVSTDSEEIAQVARQYNAQVPFRRPDHLATDTAAKGDVIKHALLESEKYYKEKFDIVVDLDATAPLRTIEDLNNCLDLFLKGKPKTLFSVVKSHKNPYFNMVEEKEGHVELCKKSPKPIVRRQDAPNVYDMNASIYFYDRNYLAEAPFPSPFSDQMRIYVMDDVNSIDIDREIDFKFIEFLMQENLVNL